MIALTTDEVASVRAMVIHEDTHIIAFNKPSGLSSQGGRGQVHTLDELLWAFAKPGGARPRLIHRLDRDTSGVILAAKTKPAAGFLGKALMGRRFRKAYQAIVAPGAPDPPTGAIETPLRRDAQGAKPSCASARPITRMRETAKTLYRTRIQTRQAALLELQPHTGRMHQLRVHLASIGRPIVGDPRYGGTLMLAGEPVGRLMLHAAALEFPHPGRRDEADRGRRRRMTCGG